jgi:hypothetical protein
VLRPEWPTRRRGTRAAYGLGIVRWPLPGGTAVWGHNGMIYGSFTIAAGTRDGGLVVAANVNSDDRDYSIETFSDLLRQGCA